MCSVISVGECANNQGVILSNGKCVVSFKETFNIAWDAARTKCVSAAFTNAGDLISIHSYEEHKLVFDFAYARFNEDPLEMWIGFKEQIPGNINSWYWSDGSPVDYTNWEPGEPSSASQNCGRYRGTGGVAKWWDYYCSGSMQDKIKSYVCQVDAVAECMVNPAMCFCYEGIGYTGVGCQTPICFDVPADDAATCSGHGICEDKNLCRCLGGYFGSNCNQPCPKGYYSNDGDTSCSPCQAGYWCDSASNNAQQHRCLPGEYSTSGSAVCGACYAGYYCAANSPSPTQYSCTAGQWSPSNSSQCFDCDAGYYCTANSPSAQQNRCPAGQYSPSGSNQCYDCDAGYICSSGSPSATQTPCAAGKYSTAGSSVCSNCQSGFYCTGAASSPTQYPCDPGTWSSSGSASCLPCAAGFYCPTSASTTATPSQCPQGHYCVEGTSSPEPCYGGYICLTGSSQPDLIPCPAGYYSTNGSSSCSPCSAGYFCPNEASHSPTSHQCPAGTWSSDGSVVCSPCSAGHYCPAGSNSSTAEPCPSGTYSGAGAAHCTNATAGYHVPNPGSTVQQKCQPGTYSSGGASVCTPCPGGTYSSTGATICSPCNAGTYSTGNMGYCSSCPSGYYCPQNSPTPTLCPNGTFSVPLSESIADCHNCSASYYCISPSSTPQQHAAPPGFYTNNGAFSPLPCPEGFYCIGASPPLQCASGEYSVGGSSSCDPCPPGFYCPSGSLPQECAPGTHSIGGATQCLPCNAGTYSSTNGAISCTNCTRGYACVAGSTSPTQDTCQPGYWSWDGFGACQECDPGYACPSTASTTSQEVPCEPGQFSSGGFASCLNCTSGSWCGAISPSPTQNPCPEGWWSLGGSSSVSQCTIPVCGGVPANNPLTCSNHGDCLNPNNCQCDSGYGGNTCEFAICFGKNSSSACSHPAGTCTAPDVCTCLTGYLGTECEIPTCFGVSSTSNTTCSGRGECLDLNQCVCASDTGYTGANCHVPICFNISADNSSVCSGHGQCLSPGTCICQANYILADCSLPVCFGYNASDSSVCSSHGTCELANQCACTSEYSGLQCDQFSCFGVSKSSASACSGHGVCIEPNSCNCTTPNLYTGPSCGYPICYGVSSDALAVCTNRQGVCKAPDTCSCEPGFEGTQCEDELENQPVSVLRMPEFIGECDSLDLDGTLSYAVTPGAIKYYWRCESGDDCDYINYWLQQNSDPTKSTQLLVGTMLSFNSTYTISHYVVSAQGVSGKRHTKTVRRLAQTTPQVVIRGASSVTIHRGEPITLNADVTLHVCSSQTTAQSLLDSATYSWTQVSGPSLGTALPVHPHRATVLSFAAHTFPAIAATYGFRLTVTLALGASSWAHAEVNVLRRDLVARIAGGQRTLSQSKTLILNAQSSFDPEQEATTASFVWSCDKCPGTVPLPSWSEITIPANALTPGEYRFTVTYSKGLRSAQSTVRITILASSVAPSISLSYPTIINKNERLVIDAHVSGIDLYSTSTPVQSYWTVTSSNLELDDTLFVERQHSRTRTQLALKEDVLQEGETYEFSFRVVTNDAISSSTATVTVNSQPVFGQITVSPMMGYMLDTTFTAVSQGWYDVNQPLMYSFHLVSPNGEVTLLQSYSKKNTVSFVTTQDGSLTLRCRIKDSLGGVAVHDTTFSVLNSNALTVSTTDAFRSATQMIGNLSSTAVEFEEKVSRLKASMQYINAFTSECQRKGCDSAFISSVSSLQMESMNNIRQLVRDNENAVEGDISSHIVDAVKEVTVTPALLAQSVDSVSQVALLLNVTTCGSVSAEFAHSKIITSISNTLSASLLTKDASLIQTVQTQASSILHCLARSLYQQHINGEDAIVLQSEHYSLTTFKDLAQILEDSSGQWIGQSTDARVRVSPQFLSDANIGLDESIVLTVTRYSQTPHSNSDRIVSPVVDVTFYYASDGSVLSSDVSTPHIIEIPAPQSRSNKVLMCKYWNTNTQRWSAEGVEWDSSTRACLAYHTTSFALFEEDKLDDSQGDSNRLVAIILGAAGGGTLLACIIGVCLLCVCLLAVGGCLCGVGWLKRANSKKMDDGYMTADLSSSTETTQEDDWKRVMPWQQAM